MTRRPPIYLDNAASTPCDPSVVEAMTPFFATNFGNPACRHGWGTLAAEAVESARRHAANLIGAAPGEIIWTAGATESNNLAIKGVARAAPRDRRHVVTSAIEHKAVRQPCRRLQAEGFEVTFVEPGPHGIVSAEQVAAALRHDTPVTVLVSIIAVNNEIGTVSEVREIGALCRDRGVLFHTDATQMVGLLPVDVRRDHIDLLSFSGHKISGPKGVGALYVRDRDPPIAIQPVIEGGAHERGLRAGTLNVPGIVGLGRACELCAATLVDEGPRLLALRRRLEDGLRHRLGELAINGDPADRAPHITNLCLPSLEGTAVVEHLSEVACSSGSAIGAAGRTTSHVLAAIGVPDELAMTSLRLSLGRTTTAEQIDLAIDHIVETIETLRRTANPVT